MMGTVITMSLLALAIAIIGACFLDGNALKVVLWAVASVVWLHLTLFWWLVPLLEKLAQEGKNELVIFYCILAPCQNIRHQRKQITKLRQIFYLH